MYTQHAKPKPESSSRERTIQGEGASNQPNSLQSPEVALHRSLGNQAMLRLAESDVVQALLRPGWPSGRHVPKARYAAGQVRHTEAAYIQRQEVDVEEEVEEEEAIQAKLKVGLPNDPYEQEADRVAEQVLRMPESAVRVQPECACGDSPGSAGERAECGQKRLVRQPASISQTSPAPVPPSVHDMLRSPGRPLDPATRAFMEPRFGHDFGRIRVHTDARAAGSARAVNAWAYTVGRNIVFSPGQYAPETGPGRRLLAHELTHTIQQHAGVLALQRQATPTPATPTGPTFSVNQAAYLQMVRQAVQQIGGPLVTAETLAGPIQPILQAMLAQVTWRDQNGTDHGGGTVTYSLPGRPPLALNLQLVLDDQVDPPDQGRFSHSSPTDGIMTIRIRENAAIDELTTTLFHEALHMMEWIINRPGPSRVAARSARAVRSLRMNQFRTQIAGIRRRLELLAQSVNARRRVAGQSEITSDQLDRMAPWLMEEVQVRAETEVFRLLSDVQRQRGRSGPSVFMVTGRNIAVNRQMVDRYVFDFSQHFLPGDRTGLTPQDREVLRRLTEILEGFFQLQVRRRVSLTAYTASLPRPRIQWTPPPLTQPSFSPLPLPQ